MVQRRQRGVGLSSRARQCQAVPSSRGCKVKRVRVLRQPSPGPTPASTALGYRLRQSSRIPGDEACSVVKRRAHFTAEPVKPGRWAHMQYSYSHPRSLRDIPENNLVRITSRLHVYSTALFRVWVDQGTRRLANPIGSGTFVSIGGAYGVLTAQHVAE